MKQKLLILIGTLLAVLPLSAEIITGNYGAVTSGGLKGSNITFTLDTSTGVLEISGYGKSYDRGSSDREYPEWYKYSDAIKTIIIDEGITYIGMYMFQGCVNVTSITVPNSLEDLGWGAFYGGNLVKDPVYNERLFVYYPVSGGSSYTIPDGIEKIATTAFLRNENIEKVILSPSVVEIGESAFQECVKLKHIVFSKDLEVVGKNAFYQCDSLENIELPATVKEIKEGTFRSSGVRNISIPNSVTTIGASAFQKCLNLQSIVIPNSVTTIESYVFEDCSNLQSIVIPNSVIRIGSYCFSDCYNLRSVTLGCNTAVGKFISEHSGSFYYNVFNGCKSLEELVIGAEENSVNGRIELNYGVSGGFFNESNTLKLIKFNACSSFYYDREEPKKWIKNVSELLSAAGNVRDVIITDKAQSIPLGYLSDCDSLQSLTLPYINSNFGVLFDYQNNDFIENRENMKPVVQELRNGEQKTYYLPAGLDSIKISEGCEEIPWGCLYNCSMVKRIVLPESLYSVGEKAFYGCAGMEDIYCAAENPPAAYDNSFEGMRLVSCRLHVPVGSREKYKQSPGWERFFEIVEDSTVGIDDVARNDAQMACYGVAGGLKVMNAQGSSLAVYTLHGSQVCVGTVGSKAEIVNLAPGIYIANVSGEMFKVVVK